MTSKNLSVYYKYHPKTLGVIKGPKSGNRLTANPLKAISSQPKKFIPDKNQPQKSHSPSKINPPKSGTFHDSPYKGSYLPPRQLIQFCFMTFII